MKKWVCLVCGWTYDEAMGWPDDDIAPGTKWEDIPDDWVCPDCGVGKEDFEMVEVVADDSPAAPAPVAAVDPIVIIGSGLAAYNLAKEIRRRDTALPVMMISRDDGSLYYKPNLSSGLTQNKTPDDLVMSRQGQVATDLEVTLRPFTAVTAIDPEDKRIHMGAESQAYSKLVLATGAGAVRPVFSGDAGHLVHSVNDLLDYRKYRSDLVCAARVVIIGAGLIGCEFTNDLLNRGLMVDVIDAGEHAMPNLLPAPAARALEQALAARGAVFHFGTTVTSVDKSGEGYAVGLDSGATLEGDLVLSAVGLRAHTALAAAAGLEVGRGVTVNAHLETSAPDIYALGDCADVDGQHLMYVAPLLLSARALAQTLTGQRTPVAYNVMPVVVKTPACPVVVAPPRPGIAGDWEIQGAAPDVEAIYRDRAGEVAGFALTGEAVQRQKDLIKE